MSTSSGIGSRLSRAKFAMQFGADAASRFPGGWAAHARPMDLAKFDLLHLYGGSWNGEALIDASCAKAIWTAGPNTACGLGVVDRRSRALWHAVVRGKRVQGANGLHPPRAAFDPEQTDDLPGTSKAPERRATPCSAH